ncbi:MAG: portal protein [Chlorobiaceae bacterium]
MTENLQTKYQEIIEQFDEVQLTEKNNRDEALRDRRFIGVTGGSYEGFYANVFENKPRIEVDKVSLQISRIEGEYRRNKMDVTFHANDPKDDITAQSATDLFRACRNKEGSDEAETNSFSEALRGGLGSFRFCVEDEDDENDESDKEISLSPIFDADNSVYFDPNSKRQDKADASWVAVITGMTPIAYKKEYPLEAEDSAPHVNSTLCFEWYRPEKIYVAEWYEIEMQNTRLVTFLTLTGEEVTFTKEELTDEILQDLADNGLVTDNPEGEKVKRKRVHKYIVNGSKILRDCGFIAGKSLPIIPVYGERFYVDGVERFNGKVRKTKDVVRIKNVNLSKLVETAAYSAVEKPIFLPEQIQGLEAYWTNDHINNLPYALINPITDASGTKQAAPPVGYTHPPQVPPGVAALLVATDADLSDIMGNQQAGEAIVSNISGKAVELIQNKISQQSYIYFSNMAKALKRGAEVYLDLLKEVHPEAKGKKLTGMNDKGKRTTIELGKEVKTEGGQYVITNDFKNAELYAVVTIGPNSDSKKEALVRMLLELLGTVGQSDPELAYLLASEIMLNIEGSDSLAEIQTYVRMSLIKKGVIKPTPEEAQALQDESAQVAPPSAQDEFLKAQAAKTMSDIAVNESKIENTNADTEKIKADILKIVTDLHAATSAAQAQASQEQYLMLQGIMSAIQQQNAAQQPAPTPTAVPAPEPQSSAPGSGLIQ